MLTTFTVTVSAVIGFIAFLVALPIKYIITLLAFLGGGALLASGPLLGGLALGGLAVGGLTIGGITLGGLLLGILAVIFAPILLGIAVLMSPLLLVFSSPVMAVIFWLLNDVLGFLPF